MAPARSGVLSDSFILKHCMKYQPVPMAAVTKVLGKTADGRPPPRPATFATMAKNLVTINPQLRMDKIVDTYREELTTVARELKVTRRELAPARPTTPSTGTGSNTSATNADPTPPDSLDGYEEFNPRHSDEDLDRLSSEFLRELASGQRSTTESFRGRRASLLAEEEVLDERIQQMSPSRLRPRDIDYMRQRAAMAGPSRLLTDPQEYLDLAGSGYGDELGFDPKGLNF